MTSPVHEAWYPAELLPATSGQPNSTSAGENNVSDEQKEDAAVSDEQKAAAPPQKEPETQPTEPFAAYPTPLLYQWCRDYEREVPTDRAELLEFIGHTPRIKLPADRAALMKNYHDRLGRDYDDAEYVTASDAE
jgi:hypothetical protein